MPYSETVRHLYVHFPFCARICPYCAFYKTRGNSAEVARFCDALTLEAKRAAKSFPLDLETISFGGGTPSALSTSQLRDLLDSFREIFDLGRLREWSLEANPGSVSLGKATVLREGGIDRLSLGVQSWDDNLLQLLGREHDARQAEESFRVFRSAGFTNISIDLMFGLPHQTLPQWQRTLEKTVALAPEHISTYCLTYEEDTEFFRRFQRGEWIVDEEGDAQRLEFTISFLESAGYEQYEISNYARPGFRSQHNQAYWRGADYLGLGPSAFSTHGHHRWQNVADHHEYATRVEGNSSLVSNLEHLSPEAKLRERIALGLRTGEGIGAELVATSAAEHLIAAGLLTRRADRLSLTSHGKLLADSVAGELI